MTGYKDSVSNLYAVMEKWHGWCRNQIQFESLMDTLFISPAFGGLGDMLMPAMAPQPAGAAPMAASPVKPVGGNLDSTMANLAGSKFQYSTPQAFIRKPNVTVSIVTIT